MSESEIAINLVCEDALSCAVLQKLLKHSRRCYRVGSCHTTGGFGWIKKKVEGFNRAARGMPYLILTDLDASECPPALLTEWGLKNRHPNLLFSVAVRQVESWVLACRQAFAQFLGIREGRIPLKVDDIPNAKIFLINLARESPKRELRMDIVPPEGSTAKVGPDYNGRLSRFVEQRWDPGVAKESSPSLRRAVELLDRFEPCVEKTLIRETRGRK